MIGELLLIDLGLINTRLKDINNNIDDFLNTQFKKGKESSIFYNNLEQKSGELRKISLIETRNLENCL